MYDGAMPLLRRELLQMLLAPRVDYRDYSRVLPDFMERLAREAYSRRKQALDRLTTAPAIRARQQWARETFWRLVGGEPQTRSPLAVRVTGGFERSGYKVENIVYETMPGFHATANLYLPKRGAAPYPAVLFQCGHSLNGKASPLYQYCCQALAQLGFAVLAFDPMGQGERTFYPATGSNLTRLDSADTEHTIPGKQLLLTGLTSTWIQTWDAVRSFEVLASHPSVDPRRIGATGNSGGGTLTMFLAAVESRLACASAACPNTDPVAALRFNSPGASDDAEQNILDSGPVGFDRWDTLYPMAPKPLQILVSAKDAFGTYSSGYIANGRVEFAGLQRIYKTLGREANLEWIESPVPHGLSYGVRMAIYRWMRLHLQGVSTPLENEPPTAAEKDEMLYATPTGNAVRDFRGDTPVAIARRKAAPESLANRVSIPGLLRLGKFAGTLTRKGEADSRHARIEAVEIVSEPDVYLPAWIFHPKHTASKSALIVLEPGGRNSQWNEDSLCQQLAARGVTVWAADVRGIGDLRPEFPRHSPGYAAERQTDEAYAWTALMLGRPLLGQRVTDLLAVARTVNGPVKVAARGSMTVAALFAAELELSIQNVFVNGGPRSYRQMLEQEDAGPTSNLLFNVLAHIDLPDLAKGRVQQGGEWSVDALSAFAGL
jgi:cephalosporin-C deacetylase-like acetyl esterase